MSQALYRRYRPQVWDEVIGQEHVVQTLKNSIVADRVSHAYLFAGPRGTGKTTMARLLAKAVNCLDVKASQRPCNQCEYCTAVNENRFLDLIEIDAASNTSVEDVRDLRDRINFTPTQGRYKIYIVDEVHMLSTSAFNALLKTLEEPPPHAIFVLATTEIHKIPATVISRCQRYEFRRVSVDEIVENLKKLVRAEKLEADEEALLLIARQATGSIRDAQSLLDQLASMGTRITLAQVQTVLGTAASQTVLEIIQALRDENPAAGFEAVHRALDAGADPRSLARQIVDYLRGTLLIQLGNIKQVEAPADVKKRMQADAEFFSNQALLRMTKKFNSAATDLRSGWQPSLNLELAIAELIEAAQTTEEGHPPGKPGLGKPTPVIAEKPESKSPPGKIVKANPIPNPTESGESRAPYQSGSPVERKGSGMEESKPVSPGISTAEVIKSWKPIAAAINKDHPNLAALLNSVKLFEVQGNTLVLGFKGQVLVDKMAKPEYIELTRKALLEALNVELELRCVVTNARGKLPPDIQQDGMVATALNQGGEIVDTQD